jgi:hypothetical protein
MEKVKPALVHVRLGPWGSLPFQNELQKDCGKAFAAWVELDEHVSAWVWDQAMKTLESSEALMVLVEDFHLEGTQGIWPAKLMGSLKQWLQEGRLKMLFFPDTAVQPPWLKLFPDELLQDYADPLQLSKLLLNASLSMDD